MGCYEKNNDLILLREEILKGKNRDVFKVFAIETAGGKTTTYGLKDKGVDLTTKNLSAEAKKAVEDAKAKILDGSIKVPTDK